MADEYGWIRFRRKSSSGKGTWEYEEADLQTIQDPKALRSHVSEMSRDYDDSEHHRGYDYEVISRPPTWVLLELMQESREAAKRHKVRADRYQDLVEDAADDPADAVVDAKSHPDFYALASAILKNNGKQLSESFVIGAPLAHDMEMFAGGLGVWERRAMEWYGVEEPPLPDFHRNRTQDAVWRNAAELKSMRDRSLLEWDSQAGKRSEKPTMAGRMFSAIMTALLEDAK